MKQLRKAIRYIRSLPFSAPRYHATSGLVAVFWHGPATSGLVTCGDWPLPGPRRHWVGIFDRHDDRCLVVTEHDDRGIGGGQPYVLHLARVVEALGYRVTSNSASVPGPFGAVMFEVEATPAAGLPADVTKMPWRPAPTVPPTAQGASR